ncbi:MAG: DedA family protein [Microbacterium sp.]
MSWLNDALSGILDAVEGVEPWLRILITTIAIALETSVLIGLIVPGDTIVIVSATGVTSVAEGVVLGVFVVAGAIAGESLGFLIGRWAGPHLRSSRVGRWIGEKNWQRAENYLRRRGGIAIFLSRFLPVMHSLVPLTVGMSGYRYRKFLAWTLPACIVWTSIYIGIAAGAAGTYRELGDQLGRSAHWVGFLFVGILLAFFLVVWIVKKLLHRTEERHMEQGHDAAADDAIGGAAARDDDATGNGGRT